MPTAKEIDYNEILAKFAESIENPRQVGKNEKLFCGVDLGTAYIVVAVIDEEGEPVAGAYQFAEVVRDGLVVDYTGAVKIVRKLKAQIEEKLGVELKYAATAYPPGTGSSDNRAIRYTAEAAGFEVLGAVDEPTAANAVLGIKNGAVVDIGGGTTGTAIFQKGEVVYVADDATGGTQFTLVVAGGMKIPFEEAEVIKKDPDRVDDIQPMLKAVMQKVATIVSNHIKGHRVDKVYLVGGTSCNKYIDKIVAEELGKKVIKPDNPFFVTPLGIAKYARKLFLDREKEYSA